MSGNLLEIGMDALRRARIWRARVLTRRIGKFALAAAALCVATAPSPSFADRTISENLTLTEDTDWSGEGTVTIAEGVTLDLNGYALKVAAINGAGSIVDSLADYERLEYIQSTGTQYIDTGYKHDDTTKVDMRIEFDTVSPDWQCFYGSRNYDSNAQDQFSMWLNKNKFRPSIAERGTAISSPVVSTGTIYDIHLEKKKGGSCTATPEGGSTISLGSATVSGASLPANDYLLIVHQYHDKKWYTEFPTYAKLYSCQIYSGETLERDFVPVKRRSDGVLGLLDKANGAFYANAGTGTFIAGAKLSVGGLRIALSGIGVASDFSGLTVGEGVTLAFVGKGALAADLDVTKFTSVEVSSGAILDLAGHNLTVNSVVGAGTITDTVGTALSGYDRLEYIQATGTQCINTGYVHNDTTKVDIRVSFDSVSKTWQCIYGARNAGNNKTRFTAWLGSNKFRRELGATGQNIDSPVAMIDVVYDIHLDKTGYFTVTPEGGEMFSKNANSSDNTSSGGALADGQTDFLLGVHELVSGQTNWTSNHWALAKLYSCKIYSGETLERDFVPVKRKSDGAIGLLDLANGGFYANAGTGTFNEPETAFTTTPGGELHIVVAEGATASLGDMVKIAGTVKVVKTGAGELSLLASGHCFAGGMEVAGGTLSMTATPDWLEKTPVTATAGGTISITATDGASYANDFTIAGGTLKVLVSGTGATTTAAIAGTLALETGANDAQPTVFIDTTGCSSGTFRLDTTALTVGTGVTAAPGFVLLPDATTHEASIVDGTSIQVDALTAPVTAVWTGEAEDNNFDNPANWSCSNKKGVALANTTLPDGSTATFRLAADADWTTKGAIALGEGVTLDLAGRNLTVSAISGTGTVTDTVGTALSGYERLDYIQATGTQYIDTGYVHDDTTIVDMRIEFDNVSETWQCFYGSRNYDSNAQDQFSMWLNGNKFRPSIAARGNPIDSHTVTTGTIYDIHLEKQKGGTCNATPEGGSAIPLGSAQVEGSSLPANDYLFVVNQWSLTYHKVDEWYTQYNTQAKLYSCKIYSGETLERDFVPVRRKRDNVLGLLDLANGGFYVNTGTGTFNAGAVVATTQGGELRIAVADGATVDISATTLTGGLKLVKTGAGTLVMSKASQGYTGGTDVQGGTLMSGAAAARVFGAEGTDVAVGSAGNIDLNGNANLAAYGWTVAGGGTIVNGGAAIAASLAVSGVFSPVVTTGNFGATLSDGATLDFTKWTDTFPVVSPAISYASGANIALKLEPATTALTALARSKDPETGKRNGYLLGWDAIPSGVTFRPDTATRSRFRVTPDENGLRVSFKGGFCIIIK